MSDSAHKLIPSDFDRTPSLRLSTDFLAVEAASSDIEAIGFAVRSDGEIPAASGIDWDDARGNGFEGRPGQLLVVPRTGADVVLVGVGDADASVDGLRDAVAGLVRAARHRSRLAFELAGFDAIPTVDAAAAVAESAILSRYRYTALKTAPEHTALDRFEIVSSADGSGIVNGATRGIIAARGTALARDLANTPPGYLTAVDFAEVAQAVGARFGLEVEVADKAKLIELGCGGLLGVNAASADEPRMIVLRYTPKGEASGHVALVGKGITYDSGGISLKPTDPMHAVMKMDMSGAAAVLGAMATLHDLGVGVAVTGYLMCTDNMPSGSATKLGDVLTIHGGTTVEVKNTDAEGRLVMADALVLAKESAPDAIIDIATLTGAALVALGSARAAVLGTGQPIVDGLVAAAESTDEPLWQLPLERKYRKELDSQVADIANVGGRFAGATTAALFLAEFVGDVPWAHVDMAATMQVDADESWRSKGATGYGSRLLARFLEEFTAR